MALTWIGVYMPSQLRRQGEVKASREALTQHSNADHRLRYEYVNQEAVLRAYTGIFCELKGLEHNSGVDRDLKGLIPGGVESDYRGNVGADRESRQAAFSSQTHNQLETGKTNDSASSDGPEVEGEWRHGGMQ